jgi:hypothetical protein
MPLLLSFVRNTFGRVASYFPDVISKYEYFINAFPIKTKCVTTGFIYLAGDFISQKKLEHHGKSATFQYDVKRGLTIFIVGAVTDGYICHVWYNFLSTFPVLFRKFQLSSVRLVVAKVFADQIMFGPIHIAGFFFSYGIMSSFVDNIENAYLQKKTLESIALKEAVSSNDGSSVSIEHEKEVLKELYDKAESLSFMASVADSVDHTSVVFMPTFLSSCVFWTPVQFVNFKYVALRYQVLFMNSAALLFNTYMSFMANKKCG